MATDSRRAIASMMETDSVRTPADNDITSTSFCVRKVTKETEYRFSIGDKVLAYYNGLPYEGKCKKRRQIDTGDIQYFIHYTGFNKRFDEWINDDEVLEINEINLSHRRRVLENMKKLRRRRRKNNSTIINSSQPKEKSRKRDARTHSDTELDNSNDVQVQNNSNDEQVQDQSNNEQVQDHSNDEQIEERFNDRPAQGRSTDRPVQERSNDRQAQERSNDRTVQERSNNEPRFQSRWNEDDFTIPEDRCPTYQIALALMEQHRLLEMVNLPYVRVSADSTSTATDDNMCVVCSTEIRLYALVPCGHLCLCADCVLLLQPKRCPLCNNEFENFIRIWE